MKTLNFQRMFKSNKQVSFALLLSSITLSGLLGSCKKENILQDQIKTEDINKSAALPTGNSPINIGNGASGTITRINAQNGGGYLFSNYFVDQGIFTHPDSIYHRPNGSYYLKLSTGDNKIGTPPADYDLEFTGTGNGYIKVKSGITLKVVDKAYKDVTSADLSSATSATIGTGGFGHDNTIFSGPKSNLDNSTSDKKGWFNYYFPNHEVVPITNRILLFTVGTTTYAFEFLSVYKDSTPAAIAPSTFPNNYSNLNFRYKVL